MADGVAVGEGEGEGVSVGLTVTATCSTCISSESIAVCGCSDTALTIKIADNQNITNRFHSMLTHFPSVSFARQSGASAPR